MSSRERSVGENIRNVAAVAGLFVGGVVAVRAIEQFRPADLEDHRGEVVRGIEFKQFMTDIGTYREIPVRTDATRGADNIVGFVPNNMLFSAQEVYGVTYPSYPETLGKFEYDGKNYGSWYRGDSLPIFEKGDGGNLVPKLDEQGKQIIATDVYIAGNFLRLATEAEITQSQENR